MDYECKGGSELDLFAYIVQYIIIPSHTLLNQLAFCLQDLNGIAGETHFPLGINS